MSGQVTTVQEACDAIWSCKVAEEVVPWLKLMHETLLKDPLDAYDPSEAFLAIQGAALRFHPSQQLQEQREQNEKRQQLDSSSSGGEGEKQQPTQKEGRRRDYHKSRRGKEKKKKEAAHTVATTTTAETQRQQLLQHQKEEQQQRQERYKQFYWSICEESLWAAAALACVCVGPAWRFQLYQRRLYLSHRGKQSRYTGSQDPRDDQSMSTFSSGGANFDLTSRDVSVASGSLQSFPPITMNSSAAGGGMSDQHASHPRYPPVPEVLPAAMLRFAASSLALFPESLSSMTPQQQETWITQQKTIAIAQRYLVLALCCESPHMNNTTQANPSDRPQPVPPRSTDWTIPGAHELVGNMLGFWLRAADTSHNDLSSSSTKATIDWWYTQRVARASTDLVSTGWRPLPKTNIGIEVVERLLGIAEKSISLLKETQSIAANGTTTTPVPTQQSREERLAASSSMAEAISALASLSSRGLIPWAAQQSTAQAVCRLHVVCGAIKTSSMRLRSSSANEREDVHKLEAEEQIFMDQIESCFADTADLLWILFATEASSQNAMTAFLEMVNTANLKSPSCTLVSSLYASSQLGRTDWDFRRKLICMEAGTAVRMMSAAAWGRPPDVVGIPHLRNYWGTILQVIRNVASSIHAEVHEEESDVVGSSSSQRDMLSLALDTVVALGNFIDRELVGGNGVVSLLEWEAFLGGLEEVVEPWLTYPRSNLDVADPARGDPARGDLELEREQPEILERAHLEIESLLLRVGALLNKCVGVESSPFHAIIDYEKQRKLYLFIFEKAIPHMDDMDAELLGLSVVSAWSKFGMHPYRHDGLVKTATEIIEIAFTRYDNGSHAHSARVRLQALKVLAPGDSHLGSPDERSSPSNPPTSDASVASQLSLLFLTQEQRALHAELIDSTIMPTLKTLLLEEEANPEFRRVLRKPQSKLFSPRFGQELEGLNLEQSSSQDNSVALESFAVGLTGRMIRDFGGGREHEAMFVSVLCSVAINGTRETTNDVGHKVMNSVGENVLYERLRQQGSVRLESVKELEVCLSVPFGEQPKKHQMVPFVLDALCKILTTCTESLVDCDMEDRAIEQLEGALVAVAALIPLSRLKSCDGNKLALLGRREVTARLPDALLPLLARNERQPTGGAAFPSQVAPFVFVSENSTQFKGVASIPPGPNRALVPFDVVLASVVRALANVSKARDHARAELGLAMEATTRLCLKVLGSSLLSGCCISPTLHTELIAAASRRKQDLSLEESLSWVRAQAALVQSIVSGRLNVGGGCARGGDQQTACQFVELLLVACNSPVSTESTAACRALTSFLPSLTKMRVFGNDGSHIAETIFIRITRRLTSEVSVLDLQSESDVPARVAHPTTALFGVLNEIVRDKSYQLSPDLLSDLFQISRRFISRLVKLPATYCLYVVMSSLVATINKLPSECVKRNLVDCQNDVNTEGYNVGKDRVFESEAPSARFVDILVFELLLQRLQVMQNKPSTTQFASQIVPSGPFSHESFAMELDFMDRFQVDDDVDPSRIPEAAWLCGECRLLTCRVGSSTSRYRGWVEVIVRSPTARKRVLVRLLSTFSLRNPEATSMLWSNTPSTGNPVTSDLKPTSSENISPIGVDSSSALERATSVIARFDLLTSPTGQDDVDPADPSEADPSLAVARQKQASKIGGFATVDSRYAGNPDDLSIDGWLSSVFDGNADRIKDVKHALRRLDFSEEMMSDQYPSTSRVSVRRLQHGPRLARAISVLDRTAPSDTHKIALLYAGPKRIGSVGDNAEAMLLEARNCSPPYHLFSNMLGSMVLTRHLRYFSAGLDVSSYESDGEYTRAWVGNDDSNISAATSIIVYHVVNLMPEGRNNRKRHVGNDNILVVFVDEDSPIAVDIDLTDFEQEHSLISGHFAFVTIYCSVLPQPDLLRVTVRIRQGIPTELREELLPFAGDDVLPFHDAADYVRSLAMRADTAVRATLDSNLASASNLHQRYRILCEMSRHVAKETVSSKHQGDRATS